MKDQYGFNRVRIDKVRVTKVLMVDMTCGDGIEDDPVRPFRQIWTLDGTLIAEVDCTQKP